MNRSKVVPGRSTNDFQLAATGNGRTPEIRTPKLTLIHEDEFRAVEDDAAGVLQAVLPGMRRQ